MEMHYGEDEYSVSFNAVEYTIRESAGKTATDIAILRWPSFGVGKDVLNRCMDFYRKVFTETGFAFFVVVNCFVKFYLGFRME